MKKETISKVMAHLGAQGTGQSKVRGDSKYYSRISRMRKQKRKNNGNIVQGRNGHKAKKNFTAPKQLET